MSLFKIFKGPEANLASVPLHEGYAYFTEDECNFYIDIGNNPGDRVQVNAYAAQVLKNDITEIDIDDIFLRNMTATVAQGGTGRNNLTVNALLVGNGTEPVKLVSIDDGGIVIGDSTNGVESLLGTGVLYAATSGAPQFGVAPITVGGTGAADVATARSNLDVYSKTETDTVVNGAKSLQYTTTLTASGWVSSGDSFTYNYSNAALACGSDGTVSPIISYTSNLDEYSKIDSAEATPGVGIVFTTVEQPASDIGILIIDVK